MEKAYKQAFAPAEWIPKKSAEQALYFYKQRYDWIMEAIKSGNDATRLYLEQKALEILCTDPELNDFWKTTNAKSEDGNMIMGIFLGPFFGFQMSPRITISERNKRLTRIDNLLEEISDITQSDWSVHGYVSMGLMRTMGNILKKFQEHNKNIEIPKLTHYPPEATQPHILFEAIREEIGKVKQKTHAKSPKRTVNNERVRERVYFMNSVSDLVQYAYAYKRANHEMTARILNKIRPDLGTFTADNIRQTVVLKEKPKR